MHESEPVLDAKYEKPYEQRRLAILQKLIPEGNGDKALDLGCGSGVISGMLRNHGWSVTAVDLHPGNVARAKEKGFLAVEGDVINAVRSFADAQFGLVCATELIEHLDEEYRGELLSGAIKAVRPGGYLLLSTPNRMSPVGLVGYYYLELMRGVRFKAWDDTHKRIYSSFEIHTALKRAGWHIVRTVGYHYHYSSNGFSLPIQVSYRFPINRFGFNTMMLCRRAN
jgi:2-polyprenyl-3-methyl-5-hydroxy-6-metoxy-1,4-benzoquinol methylase